MNCVININIETLKLFGNKYQYLVLSFIVFLGCNIKESDKYSNKSNYKKIFKVTLSNPKFENNYLNILSSLQNPDNPIREAYL